MPPPADPSQIALSRTGGQCAPPPLAPQMAWSFGEAADVTVGPVAQSLPRITAPAPRTSARSSGATLSLCFLYPGIPRFMAGCRPRAFICRVAPHGSMRATDQPVSPRCTAFPSHGASTTDPTGSRGKMGHTHQQPGWPTVVGGCPWLPPRQASATPRSATPLRHGLLYQPARLRPCAPSPGPEETSRELKSSGHSSGARAVGRHAICRY
ncbi:hypothetical protein NDU88_006221 [Pleurodeles waltl]|uniref:Uncharacterized protein n=1 Tax=Pleurodeles waltl TaxID=8319 RepID=A0AAV7PQ14_PLEWA|nr:hypothetical protein NDU88_006221 [Pleurodeles waltl]